ncbi:hypothetical protein [Alteromonas sp. a30]|uniref:hypothetical protein n=1 Tax=Alteromonas sp. a30 TaxID=2730917 RepID=UPI0022809D72|nr:hypothetical protein [Alteromonas sp. a30]MCY7295506.1 hypothetical protein [Alteromonas sp. a30]
MKTKLSLLTTLSGILISFSSLALTTSVEFKNTTSKAETLIDGQNVSGSITPSVPNPLQPFSSSFHLSNTPGTSVEAGVIRFSSCRFNWSTINLGGIYSFSRGAEPSSDCAVEVLQQNVFTGEHNVRFIIK